MSEELRIVRWRPGPPTEKQRAAICQAIAEGNFRETAARYAAVPLTTFYRWCAIGRKEPNSPYGEFLQAILEAESQAEMEMVELVRKSAKIDARHAQWWLTHKLPERWGDQRAEVAALRKQVAELQKDERGTTTPPETDRPTPPPEGSTPPS